MQFPTSEIKAVLEILSKMFNDPVNLTRSAIIIVGGIAGFFVGRTFGWFVGDILRWGVLADILFIIIIAGCIMLFSIFSYKIALRFIK